MLPKRRILRGFFYLSIVILTCLILLQSSNTWSEENANIEPKRFSFGQDAPVVCIIGNAQTRASAQRMHQQWSSAFPSMWYIWKENATEDSELVQPKSQNRHVFDTPKNLTWATGLLHALFRMRLLNPSCDYFFTHDDDLEFSTLEGASLSDTLASILRAYQPAVVGFPYDVWIQRRSNAQKLFNKFKDQNVAPLTGFDSGMLLYHHSIVDFFIPFTPNGQGGFQCDWSLCAHFINLFAPLVFRQSALQINVIRYRNLINMDNLPQAKRRKLRKRMNGLMMHEGSRHPYEYELNAPFKRYMAQGLRNRRMHWGRDLGVDDVTWIPKPSDLPHSKWDILARIHSFYNISHPIITKNAWIQQHFTPQELHKYALTHSNSNQSNLSKDQSQKDMKQCTLIITVFERYATLKSRLQFYQTLDVINSIALVWNNINASIPDVSELSGYKVPVNVISYSKNSLNNRFLPHPLIATDCIINMDDDWEMPHDHIRKAVLAWKANPLQIVGYRSTARAHRFSHQNNTFIYSKSLPRKGSSILLPSGMVYHRKYMHLYASESISDLRALVDRTMNCDDILFNFVVSNATHHSPIILDVFAKPKRLKKGLWKRGDHFTQRSECLNTFVEAFGYMPLVYTTIYHS